MPLFYSQLVSIERTVFDVLGQMWLTMLVNGMNLICTMTGMLGTCVKEKIAMAVVNDLPFTIRKCSYQIIMYFWRVAKLLLSHQMV